GSRAPAKVVAWNHVNGSGLTVAPDIDSLRDLGGKTVAVPFWYSIHNVVLQDMLRGQHVRRRHDDEVDLVRRAPDR
ncbi:ABC transporter substrate-binding protein, partial [Burkholderia cenocepacia]|nr:ABC transporter substrate-binding protein [Burkholderia cenocepacia]